MRSLTFAVPALLVLALPFAASAHQSAVYEIGGTQYRFVIGSLNEPVAVDDKTGVDLRVSMVGHEAMEANDHHAAGGAVTGLEETLQVELAAGDKRKVLDLSPVHNTPGSYYASFYPTVATTLSYRVFGAVGGTPVDLTFTCRAEGAEGADEGEKDVSAGVRQISKAGGFGCPAEKEALGFPEASVPEVDVAASAGMATKLSMAALALAAVGAALSLRRRS